MKEKDWHVLFTRDQHATAVIRSWQEKRRIKAFGTAVKDFINVCSMMLPDLVDLPGERHWMAYLEELRRTGHGELADQLTPMGALARQYLQDPDDRRDAVARLATVAIQELDIHAETDTNPEINEKPGENEEK